MIRLKNRLFEADQYEIKEIRTGDAFPENLLDAVGRDVEQKILQYRSGQTNTGFGLYHGKGEGKEDKEIEIAKYLHVVDHGLNEILDDFSTPLVIASVEYICAHFQQISSQSE